MESLIALGQLSWLNPALTDLAVQHLRVSQTEENKCTSYGQLMWKGFALQYET